MLPLPEPVWREVTLLELGSKGPGSAPPPRYFHLPHRKEMP